MALYHRHTRQQRFLALIDELVGWYAAHPDPRLRSSEVRNLVYRHFERAAYALADPQPTC